MGKKTSACHSAQDKRIRTPVLVALCCAELLAHLVGQMLLNYGNLQVAPGLFYHAEDITTVHSRYSEQTRQPTPPQIAGTKEPAPVNLTTSQPGSRLRGSVFRLCVPLDGSPSGSVLVVVTAWPVLNSPRCQNSARPKLEIRDTAFLLVKLVHILVWLEIGTRI